MVVDLAAPGLTSARLYAFAGRLLISTGVVLGSLVGVRFAREHLDGQIAQKSHFLSIDSTPEFQFPPATALPTFTATPLPTATPTPTPLPLPATRLSIPAIGVNITVQETSPTLINFGGGNSIYVWDPPADAAGHYETSGYPGEGRNIVFEGHNNMAGEVFRDLDKLEPGDEVILLTDIGIFHYQVQQKTIIPYVGHEAEANTQLMALTAPQPSETVTLISCWPYATFTSRIVIVARPVPGEGE